VASDLFWNGHYGSEGPEALHREEAARFLDWFICDYRLERTRQRVIDLYLEESGTHLLPSEREQVSTWQDSYLSLYRILGPVQQGVLSVEDALQGGQEVVSDEGLGAQSQSDDLIVGRILCSSDPPHFSWGAILLPAEMGAGLVCFVQQAYGQYCEARARATWPTFLSNNGYIFNHYLLKSAASSGSARHASRGYYDASGTVERLREVEKQLRERAARQRAEQPVDEEARALLRQTRGGILLPRHAQYNDSGESRG